MLDPFTLREALVNPPADGISGWFRRTTAMVSRSRRSLVTIFLLTDTLPSIVLYVSALATAGVVFGLDDVAIGFDTPYGIQLPEGMMAALGIVLLTAAVSYVIKLIGYAAATYAATREAARMPVRLGDALRFGVRRCLGLLGYQLLIGVAAAVVTALLASCLLVLGKGGGTGPVLLTLLVLLPFVIYTLMLMAMVGPTYLFQRDNALVRGWSLLNSGFGAILGRLSVVCLVLLVGGCVGGVLNRGEQAAIESNADTKVLTLLLIAVLSAVVALPFNIFSFAGVLVTYAERRGGQDSITAVHLAAELDTRPVDRH